MYFVYVLQNPEGRLYVGFTSDLDMRVRQHQDGEGGWIRGRGPWKLNPSESFDHRADATRRERILKGAGQTKSSGAAFGRGDL